MNVAESATQAPIRVTGLARKALDSVGLAPDELVRRHREGDWGDASEDDVEANKRALEDGGPVVSSYRLTGDYVVWVATPRTSSETVVLMPSDLNHFPYLFS